MNCLEELIEPQPTILFRGQIDKLDILGE
jgi:hypothetical protein